VALVSTNVSEEHIASIIKVQKIRELGTLAVTKLPFTANVPSSLIILTLLRVAIRSSETTVLTRATRRNIPEDDILRADILLD
jgi:hypothetical protein